MILASTSDELRLTTSAAGSIHVHISWIDFASGTTTPGRTNTSITTATTTDVLASPAASTYRRAKTITIRNAHATDANALTFIHSDGTTTVEVAKITLPAGYQWHYDEHQGWTVRDATGALVSVDTPVVPAAGTEINVVTLAADVTNDNASANTIADVTGLSFSVAAGETYWFRFVIAYTAAATTTGSRWSVSGPGSPTALRYRSEYSLTTTSRTTTEGHAAYDLPAASNATSAATGANIAVVEGFITPSASGTLIARFASEVSSSAIVAKAGSICMWQRTL